MHCICVLCLICVCMCVHMCMCVHVCMCVCVCVCVCMRVHHSFFDLVRSIDWRVVGKGTVGERMRV